MIRFWLRESRSPEMLIELEELRSTLYGWTPSSPSSPGQLVPDILEELLYLPEVIQGKAAIHERLLRPLTTELDWKVQKRMWARIRKSL